MTEDVIHISLSAIDKQLNITINQINVMVTLKLLPSPTVLLHVLS